MSVDDTVVEQVRTDPPGDDVPVVTADRELSRALRGSTDSGGSARALPVDGVVMHT